MYIYIYKLYIYICIASTTVSFLFDIHFFGGGSRLPVTKQAISGSRNTNLPQPWPKFTVQQGKFLGHGEGHGGSLGHGLRENLNRKPWVFTMKYRAFRLKKSHHPIL
jgi:hypothetical protein